MLQPLRPGVRRILWRVHRAVRVARGRPQGRQARSGDGRDDGQCRWRCHGLGRGRRRCRPHLLDGLRLSLGRLGPGRLVPDGPSRRQREGPVVVAHLYESFCVLVQRTLLGLPLYGMSWPVESDEPDATRTGDGDTWVPRPTWTCSTTRRSNPCSSPWSRSRSTRRPRSTTPASRAGGSSTSTRRDATPKLALADARGLAGVGFSAIGYERGLPGYRRLINAFRCRQARLAAGAGQRGQELRRGC